MRCLWIALMFVATIAVCEGASLCQAFSWAADDQIAGATDWVCNGGGIDCSPILPNGTHYLPNTVRDHGNWAFNAYYQQHSGDCNSCDFGGIAEITCGRPSTKTIRGVNIGGFLVLEPWITPSMFYQFRNQSKNETAVDERQFCLILGADEAKVQLEKHWSTWVTEEDIKLLASFGLNTLRVPVGHWVFGDVPPYIGGIHHLDRVIALAGKHGLDVLVDLHGAPGSQNGFDNSGLTCGECAGECPPLPTWASSTENMVQTQKTLLRLANKYKDVEAVVGLELVNEPRWDIDVDLLKLWYADTYAAVRRVAPDLPIFMHDSFRYQPWKGWMENATSVFIDTHVYEAFNPDDISRSEPEHLEEACGYHTMIDWLNCEALPTVTGEWSLGTTDCPEYLLGFEKPPTAPKLGKPCPHQESDGFLKEYAARQLWTWERGAGWFFWNFKTESAPQWSYIDAVKRGWMPADVSNLGPEVTESCWHYRS